MSVVSPILLEILRCPRCMAPLTGDEATSELVCQEQGHRYPVVDGIPDMVVD
ncbi:MAG: Trm112 family protein [Acidimicrobiia bacterium]